MSTRTCPACTTEFELDPQHVGRPPKYCLECRTNGRSRYTPKEHVKDCVACGKTFTTTHSCTLTCSPECFKVHDKAKTYAWREANHERYLELCRKHNRTFAEKKRGAKGPLMRPCKICSTEFPVLIGNPLTCSPECSAENRRRNRKARYNAKKNS